MDVYGVHWPRIGVLLMTTTSAGFAGTFGLPHLTMGWYYFTTSQRLLSQTVEKTTEGKKAISLMEDDSQTAAASCQYVVYIQMHLQDKNRMWLNVSEAEGSRKCGNRGTMLGKTGSLFSLSVFSLDCGIILETQGQRLEYCLSDLTHFECEEVDQM